MFQIPSSPRVGRALRRATLSTLACAGAAATLAPASALAAGKRTWYVSASATSNPTCQTASKTTPFQTIAAALSCASSGNTVKVGAGTFAGGFTVPNGIVLDGAGANRTTISDATSLGGPEVTIASGADVHLQALTVAGGAGANGGIVAGSGALTLTGVAVNGTSNGRVSDPAAVSVIPTSGPGTLTVTDSTISNNELGLYAGGIAAGSASGPSVAVVVANSTISGNVGGNGAGGISITNGTLHAEGDTITGNADGDAGGLYVGHATATLGNDLIAGNTEGNAANTADCGVGSQATIVDDGHNLIGVAEPGAAGDCGFVNATDGDLTGTPSTPLDPKLGALAAGGGPTETQAPLPGSPAIGAGDPEICEAAPVSDRDQRGDSRAATTRFACDIGADDTGGKGGHVWPVSAKATSTPTCATASATHPFPTVADALACAQNGDTVKLGAGTFAGGFTLPANVVLEGAGANKTTVTDRAQLNLAEIGVAPEVSARITGLTVNGESVNPGIQSGTGNLVLERSVVTDAGVATGVPAPVSLDPSSGNGALTIFDSTISHSVGVNAAGVYVFASTAISPTGMLLTPPSTATIANSTLSDNVGQSEAGGIQLINTRAVLRDDTVAGNSGFASGGLLVSKYAFATVTDTVLATNTSQLSAAADDCANQNDKATDGGITDGGHNLVGVADPGASNGQDCGFLNGTGGDLTGSPSAPLDPGLGALGMNGGTTPTQALQTGSPAIGAGNPADCEAAPVSDLDQRGVSRAAPTRHACDIGAYDTGGA